MAAVNPITCMDCREDFDPRHHPICPRCLVVNWLSVEEFIRRKHDPRALPLAWDGYRSVLSPSFAENPRPHLEYAARHGTWYHDTYYDMYVHFTAEPLGLSPGAGIPLGKKTPEHALDSLMIAEANSVEAHAFAIDQKTLAAQLRAGEFEPLGGCAIGDCKNLQHPGREHCTEHLGRNRESSEP